ncbi:MAG: hypothetical protein ABSE42_01585 [Bryobacteraceae bacterium]|jgi:hypothetical protein
MIDRKTILQRVWRGALAIALVIFWGAVEERRVSRVDLLRTIVMLPALAAMLFPELGRWRWLLFTVTGLCVAGRFLYIALS